MIGRLTGKVALCSDDHALIDVGGVGYLVYCSSKTLGKLCSGELCELIIETYVREDRIQLYGFFLLEEKKLFNVLLSVNGIGTKLALTILSYLTLEQLQLAVSQRNNEAFIVIPGVGAKLAARILTELKDKVISNTASNDSRKNIYNNYLSEIASQAISALTNLGVNKLDAERAVNTALSNSPDLSIDQLIKTVLKSRGA